MVVLIIREESGALAVAGCVMVVKYLQDDATYGSWQDISTGSLAFIARLVHYFLTYKDAPTATDRKCELTHVYDRHEAYEVIRRSQADYQARFGDPDGRLTAALHNER
jgi:inorganic pyrophosphatase